jgi:hypothetical protein
MVGSSSAGRPISTPDTMTEGASLDGDVTTTKLSSAVSTIGISVGAVMECAGLDGGGEC